MSIVPMTYVMKHSEETLGNRLVELALADCAHDDGSNAYPSLQTLARHARLSTRHVRRCLRELEEHGAIRATGRHRTGTTVYSVVMKRLCDDKLSGGHLAQEGGTSDAVGEDAHVRQPVKEPSRNRQKRVRAHGRETPKIGGKPVNAESWELTKLVLDDFNRQARKKLRLLTSALQPSEAAKRVYGRVRAYPDIGLEQYRDIIERTLASRWWGASEPSIGVVFGPNVFEDNITRSGTPARLPGRPSGNGRGHLSLREKDALMAA